MGKAAKITLFMCALCFSFASGAQEGVRVLGVDVSDFQGTIDWAKVHAPIEQGGGGKGFALIRATRGGTTGSSGPGGENTVGRGRYDDTQFVANITGARAAEVLAAPYHRARLDLYDLDNPYGEVTPEDEARHFLEVAGPYMEPGFIRPVLDFEGCQQYNDYSEYIHRFVSTVVEAKGKRATPIIYINSSAANNCVLDSVRIYTLWLARWDVASDFANGDPVYPGFPTYGAWGSDYDNPKPWAFWQYVSGAADYPANVVPGIPTNVDLDVVHGDMNYLRTFVIQAEK